MSARTEDITFFHTNAEAAIAVLRDRVLAEEHKARETAPIVTMMRVNTSGAGPSGVIKKKKMIKSVNLPGGAYERPAFNGARLSPRLNPTVGGSGSKPTSAMVLRSGGSGKAPMRQPSF